MARINPRIAKKLLKHENIPGKPNFVSDLFSNNHFMEPLMIKRVDHITINTRDLEKTIRFYRDILGFPQKPTKDFSDHRYYFFEIPGGTTLEVGEYDFDESDSQDSITARGRIRHLAFEVDDIHDLQKKLENAGYRFFSPIEFRAALGFASGLLHDPNGIELEFLQYGNTYRR